MKTKKIFIPVFTLSAALLLTACSGNEAADTTKTQTPHQITKKEVQILKNCLNATPKK